MLPPNLSRLITHLKKLPSVGPKSAERIAFYLLKSSDTVIQEFSAALLALKKDMGFCERCSNWSEGKLCFICDNPSRDSGLLCIVEEATDLFALEAAGVYQGLYHVLHGALSPLDGITAEHLTIEPLMRRVEREKISEVIFATNPTVTGEATAVYISQQLKPKGLRMSRLAQGIPMGGSLEFADHDTLRKAFLGRREEF